MEHMPVAQWHHLDPKEGSLLAEPGSLIGLLLDYTVGTGIVLWHFFVAGRVTTAAQLTRASATIRSSASSSRPPSAVTSGR